MKVKWKRGLVLVCALALVVAAGVYSSDHFLKATDGDENIVDSTESGGGAVAVENGTEIPAEEEPVVAFEQGVFESDVLDEQNAQEEPAAEEITETGETSDEEAIAEESTESEGEKSVVIAYEVVGGEYTGVGSQIKLTAVPTGYENPVYQWQYNDGSDWKDLEGENSPVYVLNVTEENSSYRWRVDVEEY
jgi:hypothetical protein